MNWRARPKADTSTASESRRMVQAGVSLSCALATLLLVAPASAQMTKDEAKKRAEEIPPTVSPSTVGTLKLSVERSNPWM